MSELLEGLEKVRLLLDAISSGEYCCLRHGLPCIRVGELVEQSICEYRIHLKMSKGEIDEGRVLRDLRALAELVTGARRRLRERPVGRVFISAALAALVEGLPLVGRPDLLLIEDEIVKAVIWCKVTNQPSKVTSVDRIRMYAFGLLVDYSPLPSSANLKLVLVASRTKRGVEKGLRVLREQVKPLVVDEAWVHVMAYSRDCALEMLAPLLAYWKGLREPRASPSPSKCSSCPYVLECPWSASRMKGAMEG